MKVKQLIGGLCLLFFFSIVISDNVFADWNFLQRKGLGGAFAQNDIYFYDPCDGNFNSGKTSTIDGGCAKLSELRTAMWNAASEADRENFMFVVSGTVIILTTVETKIIPKAIASAILKVVSPRSKKLCHPSFIP